MQTSRAISRRLLALCTVLPLSACGHAWPEHGTGGLAERAAPVEPAFIATQTAIGEAGLNGGSGRASIARAEAHFILARRESEAGLTGDSEDSLLSASIALGGVDRIQSPRPYCLKEPCR